MLELWFWNQMTRAWTPASVGFGISYLTSLGISFFFRDLGRTLLPGGATRVKWSVEPTSKRQSVLSWQAFEPSVEMKSGFKHLLNNKKLCHSPLLIGFIEPETQHIWQACSGLWVASAEGAHSSWWPCLLFSALERDHHERLTDDWAHCHTCPWVDRPSSWKEGNLSSVCAVGDGGQSEVSACLGRDSFPPCGL